MAVDPPTLIESQLSQHELGGPKAPITVAESDPCAIISEAEDVRTSVAGQVDDESRMLFNTPAGVESKIRGHHAGQLEAPIAAAERRPDSIPAEAHYVGPFIAGEIGDEARKLHAPALVETELV